MPRNIYFSDIGTSTERDLYEDIIIESMKIHGIDVYYLPRKIINVDGVLNEDLISEYGQAFKIEMYLINVDGFEGDGRFLSKFGLEVRDQISLAVSKRRFHELVGRWNGQQQRPNEGDVIYFPLGKHFFEIAYAEDHTPFYQLQDSFIWKLTCETFEYEGSDIDTGIKEVDIVQTQHTQTFEGEIVHNVGSEQFSQGEDVLLTLPSGTTGSAEFIEYDEIIDSPGGLNMIIGPISWDDGKFHTLSDNTLVSSVDGLSSGTLVRIYDLSDTTEDVFHNDTPFADNTTFAKESNLFIDFSESNPFGDPFNLNNP